VQGPRRPHHGIKPFTVAMVMQAIGLLRRPTLTALDEAYQLFRLERQGNQPERAVLCS
jgi:hypothetical protein